MNLLTLCGSLRARSSNRAVLRAYERLAPSDWTTTHYDALGALPPFSPDDDHDPLPAEVTRLRALIASADLVAISTPEYVHALPGTFKNALDWLVSDPAFAGKPVVILHIARGSRHALESLREVLRTMSARLLDSAEVLLPLGTNQIDEEQIVARDDLRPMLGASWAAVRGAGLPVAEREIELSLAALAVRPYLDARDRDAVRQLWTQALGYSSGRHEPSFVIDLKLQVNDGLFWVAVEGGTVVGTIMAGYDGHRGWIYSLAVAPEQKRRGVGRALMAQAESALAAFGCPKVNLQVMPANSDVVRFYERLGYAVEPRISMGKSLKRTAGVAAAQPPPV